MSNAIHFLHWLAALVVLAESLNKLERSTIKLNCVMSTPCLLDWLKVSAWMLFALGSAGEVAAPFFPSIDVVGRDLGEALVTVGFALLIIRTRATEGDK